MTKHILQLWDFEFNCYIGTKQKVEKKEGKKSKHDQDWRVGH